MAPGASPRDDEIAARTDVYFSRTRAIVERFGDVPVTYAVFLRRPVLMAAKPALDWLRAVRGDAVTITPLYEEGDEVGAGEKLLTLTGSFVALAELETILLQKLGAPSVAAWNAREMCLALPQAGFLAMDARHCAGTEMAELMAYAASVGSRAAQARGARGFIGNATHATAHHFGRERGLGTMPHALIGYAGSTLRAAEMFVETFPDEPLTVLVDYFGTETTDALAVCRRFPDMAASGQVAFRLDTHGGRFMEGLDPAASYAVLERHAPEAIRRYRSEEELRWLVGTGVSAAAVWRMREALDEAGFRAARIVGSSGFSVAKCRIMAETQAPLDLVGTGSYLPEAWSETYATADIIAYGGIPRVKIGREFLLANPAR
ncbi:nicotinate phosphoribosyltransferase [Elioraea sp.]|uniref:nicotinate phosphoribosyltransferase n=1 Tax=Elioraea sp. TaxID=2185103 RepID=UPI0025BA288A|nr:nicotinate phosphoribosyltransferase [Elioraea sp.]